ncbi:hypothetical protein [Ralstonia solanacearum]
MKPVIAFISVCLFMVAFGIYMEISMWNECRADHSWFYCMRVLGSK